MTILFSVGGLVGNLSLEQQILLAKEAGFDGVDYIASLFDLFFKPSKILHLSKKYKITINAIHIPIFLVIYTPRFLFERIITLIEYFPEIKRFNFHLSGFFTPLGKDIEKLETFKNLMIKKNINISCESNPDEYFIFKYFPKETYDPELFAQFCMNHELPINLDTSHIAAWNYDILKFFKKYKDCINLIHLSDMDITHQHLPFGKGKLPLSDFFKELRQSSYNGYVIFEISNFQKGTSYADMLKELINSLDMFKQYTN